jgi:glycosyltransferase involved in cell wall biosynthesis
MSVAVILPAHEEMDWIGPCLDAVLASSGNLPAAREIIVVANACTDATAAVARDRTEAAAARGWALRVIETDRPGKLPALNLAETVTEARHMIYLDADVTVSAPLIAALCEALDTQGPRFATGTAVIPKPLSWASRTYGRFWQTLPFLTQDAPGFGLFAVNPAGRARWGAFPDIISDDTFVRLHFAPSERTRLDETYLWPLVEGFAHLVRVRRRQNRGVREITERFPDLMKNNAPASPGSLDILRRALRDPAGFCVYAAVALTVRTPIFSRRVYWDRGR